VEVGNDCHAKAMETKEDTGKRKQSEEKLAMRNSLKMHPRI